MDYMADCVCAFATRHVAAAPLNAVAAER